jgi:hypothetical protein
MQTLAEETVMIISEQEENVRTAIDIAREEKTQAREQLSTMIIEFDQTVAAVQTENETKFQELSETTSTSLAMIQSKVDQRIAEIEATTRLNSQTRFTGMMARARSSRALSLAMRDLEQYKERTLEKAASMNQVCLDLRNQIQVWTSNTEIVPVNLGMDLDKIKATSLAVKSSMDSQIGQSLDLLVQIQSALNRGVKYITSRRAAIDREDQQRYDELCHTASNLISSINSNAAANQHLVDQNQMVVATINQVSHSLSRLIENQPSARDFTPFLEKINTLEEIDQAGKTDNAVKQAALDEITSSVISLIQQMKSIPGFDTPAPLKKPPINLTSIQMTSNTGNGSGFKWDSNPIHKTESGLPEWNSHPNSNSNSHSDSHIDTNPQPNSTFHSRNILSSLGSINSQHHQTEHRPNSDN